MQGPFRNGIIHKECRREGIELDITDYQSLCQDEHIAVTQHAYKRFRERGIALDDIEQCIRTGRIIEEYPDDTPFPSCLVLGKACKGSPLHVVISRDSDFIYVITAYYPDPDKWDTTFSCRRKEEKQ